MAVQTLVLYGSRLYDVPTYSTNLDPEALSLPLSDSSSMSETDINDVISVLADSSTLIESWLASWNKALPDSITLTELLSIVFVAFAVFNETVLVSDSSILVAQTKGLSDFILIKEWIELNLLRAGIWQTTPAFGSVPSLLHLYGPGLNYGASEYSADPAVNWTPAARAAAIWKANDIAIQGLTLYAQPLYSQSLYGSVPVVGWTKPNPVGQQAWINLNGESHN